MPGRFHIEKNLNTNSHSFALVFFAPWDLERVNAYMWCALYRKKEEGEETENAIALKPHTQNILEKYQVNNKVNAGEYKCEHNGYKMRIHGNGNMNKSEFCILFMCLYFALCFFFPFLFVLFSLHSFFFPCTLQPECDTECVNVVPRVMWKSASNMLNLWRTSPHNIICEM